MPQLLVTCTFFFLSTLRPKNEQYLLHKKHSTEGKVNKQSQNTAEVYKGNVANKSQESLTNLVEGTQSCTYDAILLKSVQCRHANSPDSKSDSVLCQCVWTGQSDAYRFLPLFLIGIPHWFRLFEMYVNGFFVIKRLYSAVSSTLVTGKSLTLVRNLSKLHRII